MIEENEKIYKVYKHTLPKVVSGKNNDKVYIGITLQKVEYRWRNGDGYKLQTYFYNAIQKYGWNNFLHEVLFDSLSKEEAEQKEKELISFYNSTNPEFGYNIQSGGYSSECKYLEKSVICIETKIIYKSATDASRKLSISNATISSCCRGENKEAGGLHWMFADEYDDDKALLWLENAKSKKCTEVYCIDTGKTYSSIRDASLDTGIGANIISSCCSGELTHAGNLMWLYLDDVTEENINYMINQMKKRDNEKLSRRVICLETKEVYKSPNDAQDKTGINRNHIRECCQGNGATAQGYHWMYLSDYTEESAKKVLNRPKNIKAKKVRCVNTGIIYDSVRTAALDNGTNHTSISQCCKGKGTYAGKLPDGTKLRWEYVSY